MEAPRRCVYTALIGNYEPLNEQAVAAQSAVPFICLTDDPDLKSASWQIRQVKPVFGMDPIRSQREFKLRPHIHLAEFDASLYIDNSVVLSLPPESLFERFFPASGFAVPKHSFRESVLDEFLEVARLGFDDQGRIFEQLNHYSIDCPEVLNSKPYWAGMLIRDHQNPKVRAMLEIWAAHVHRYSRRDQLSMAAAFRQAGLVPDAMDIDNHSSQFHTWPHTQGRDRDKGMRLPAASFSPPVAQIRSQERAIAGLQERERALELSVAELRERGQALEQRTRRAEEALEKALAEQKRQERAFAESRTLRGMGRRAKQALKRLLGARPAR
jgi:Protein of unknown function (DUF616)